MVVLTDVYKKARDRRIYQRAIGVARVSMKKAMKAKRHCNEAKTTRMTGSLMSAKLVGHVDVPDESRRIEADVISTATKRIRIRDSQIE